MNVLKVGLIGNNGPKGHRKFHIVASPLEDECIELQLFIEIVVAFFVRKKIFL